MVWKHAQYYVQYCYLSLTHAPLWGGGGAESAPSRIFAITPKPLQISIRNLGYLILHQFNIDCASLIEIPISHYKSL